MDEQRVDGLQDRTGWPRGPWDDEPDRIEWRGDDGMPRLMLRSRLGNWCGYVGVLPGHPWHGQDYGSDAVRVVFHDKEDREYYEWPDVNGGLTFAGPCTGEPPDAICHVPQPGESDDVWWLGFDCAHLHDVIPGMDEPYRSETSTYKDERYVRRDVERLAEQARAAA